jgi:hypothetical protein
MNAMTLENALAAFKLSPEEKAKELMASVGKHAHANLFSFRQESFDLNCANLSIKICNEVIDNTADDRYGDIDFSCNSNIYYNEVKKVLQEIIKNVP